jgi:hypothetical protein
MRTPSPITVGRKGTGRRSISQLIPLGPKNPVPGGSAPGPPGRPGWPGSERSMTGRRRPRRIADHGGDCATPPAAPRLPSAAMLSAGGCSVKSRRRPRGSAGRDGSGRGPRQRGAQNLTVSARAHIPGRHGGRGRTMPRGVAGAPRSSRRPPGRMAPPACGQPPDAIRRSATAASCARARC